MLSDDIDLVAMKEWRHRIHQHPELGFEEQATSQLVTDCLQEWGYEVHRGLGKTGVVGKLVWGDGSGPRIAIRADMDALALQEETGLPWQSKVKGKMHACGHDGHTAILLGAAKALASLNKIEIDWQGTLHLIFQPAEEVGGHGGAKRMIDEGLFELFPSDAVFALHNFPGIPVGQCEFRSGPFMCSSDKVRIRFVGKGGHGGLPQLAIDPTQPLAATVIGLQSLVARNIDPLDSGVISIGHLKAGDVYNIIPEEGILELSVRALQPNVRERLHERIHNLAKQMASAYECIAEVECEYGYPVLINSEHETNQLAAIASDVFGAENVNAERLPLTGSEDFAYMLQQLPGCYVLIGNGDNGFKRSRQIGPCSVHNPHYDFNDAALEGGAKLWVSLARYYFSKHSK